MTEGRMLNESEANWIKKLRKYATLKKECLTDWEIRFCFDLFTRFDLFKENMTLTNKQWEIIHRVTDKVIK